MDDLIEGLNLSPLKRIPNKKGDILHAIKSSDNDYDGFGEAYFSIVNEGEIKGWKKHSMMHMNLIVPVGTVRFVIYDSRKESKTYKIFNDISIGIDNYTRLTVPPNLWFAFQGVESGLNLLMNIANIEHNPNESSTLELEEIAYSW